MSRPDQLSRTWGIPWKNTAASDCPPFGVIESTGVVTEGLLQGTRPTGSTTASYYFNGENTVPAGGSGFATQDSPHPAAYDTADGTPAALAEWGPQSGTWLLKNAGTGFIIEGGHGDGVVAVSRKAGGGSGSAGSVVVIKVTGATAVGGSADLDYLWASQLTDINGSYAWVDSGSAGDIYTRFIEPVQPATGRRYLALLSSQTYTGKPVYIAMSRYVDVACDPAGSIEFES